MQQIGWLPTAGAPVAYLSVRARMPGVSRSLVDRAAVDGQPLVEVPGVHARPPLLVPREDMALALRLHRTIYDRHIAPSVRSGEIDRAQITRLATQVEQALHEGPLSSAEIRAALGGDEGPALIGALLDVTLRGTVRRFPADARIDSATYRYEWLHPDDRPDLDAEGDASAVARSVTARVLRWHGPATLEEIADWAELPKAAIRAALAALDAEPVPIAGGPDESWLLPDDLRAWRAVDGSADAVALLPYRDPYVSAHAPAILSDHAEAVLLDRAGKRVRLGEARTLHHHVILCGSELVGLWDYDPAERVVVTRVWKTSRDVQRRVAEAAEDTTHFIREQLGDAKLAAVDPPARRAARLAFYRAPGHGAVGRAAGSTT